MTNKELIEKLKTFPLEMKVTIFNPENQQYVDIGAVYIGGKFWSPDYEENIIINQVVDVDDEN